MTESDPWSLLSAGHTGILTTMRRDGFPATLPIWYVVRDHKIFAMSTASARRSARIRANPKVSFLVEGGLGPRELHGVHVTGLALINDNVDLKAETEELIKIKYEAFRPRSQHPTSLRDCIVITPIGRIASWDHRTLAPR
jgi:nitroimidazol reductase NimA-like FMN-containing flavoprotein (pyridoxamine 5'-phosphate oxidase superfamily)